MDHLIEATQQADGRQVLPTAELVGDPFTIAAPVIQVQHRGHCIHAQTVEVVLLQPEQRVRKEETAHLVTAIVKDFGAPIRMPGLTRVGVLVARGAIESSQTVRVVRKMARHPIHHNADPGLVKNVDK